MASIVDYKANIGPSHQYMYVPEIKISVSHMTWWHSQSERLIDRLFTLMNQLLNHDYLIFYNCTIQTYISIFNDFMACEKI